MTAAAPPRPGRILALMCVLIAVNQLGFGYVAGPIILGLAADLLGLRAALLITVAMLGAVALAFLRWAPETHRAAPA